MGKVIWSRTPTRDDILRGSGRDNPVVASCIQLWRRSDVSWEQAMMVAVMALSSEVKSLRREVVVQMERELAPALFVECERCHE